MSVEHKRPLLAFIIVALVCGMVVGHALATQAMPALWARPAAIVEGIVFPVASAAEPTDGLTFRRPVAAAPAVAPQLRRPSVAGQVTVTRHAVARHADGPSGRVGSAHRGAGFSGSEHARQVGQGVHHGWGRHLGRQAHGSHGHRKHGHWTHGHTDQVRPWPSGLRWR